MRPESNKISLSLRSVWSFFAVRFITPGNVVRGNKKLCKGNHYGCNRPWITALEKCKQTGECSFSCIILTRLQQDFGKSGSVVLKSIHFCTKEKTVGHGKDKRPIFNLFDPEQGVVGEIWLRQENKADSLIFFKFLLSVLYRNKLLTATLPSCLFSLLEIRK